MGRKKDELLRAKTCVHAKAITKLGGLFVKDTCKNKAVMRLPVKVVTGKTIKCPYVLAKNCNSCEFYERRKKGQSGSKKKSVG